MWRSSGERGGDGIGALLVISSTRSKKGPNVQDDLELRLKEGWLYVRYYKFQKAAKQYSKILHVSLYRLKDTQKKLR